MSPITTHVLDTSAGRPAAGVPVTLEFFTAQKWTALARGITDADGRIRDLLPDDRALEAGLYCLRFDISALSEFFPEVLIRFRVDEARRHYHVPLLVSRYGYTTYRGS